MLTQNDLIYFVDPLTDPMEHQRPERLLVLEKFEGSSDEHGPKVGEVAELDPGKFREYRGAVYFEAKQKEGEHLNISHRYVTGAIANFLVRSYNRTPLIGILPDGFIYGRGTGSRVTTTSTSMVSMTDVRRSNRKKVENAEAVTASAPLWVKAARWAEQLFPLPTDDDETVELKLALAKEQYRQRRNKTILLREAAARGWVKDVEEMREADPTHFPSPRFGLIVNGKASVGSVSVSDIIDHLPARLNDSRQSFEAQPGILPNTARVNVQYDVEFFARTEVAISDVNTITDSVLANEAYESYGYGANYSSFSKTPVLRTAV